MMGAIIAPTLAFERNEEFSNELSLNENPDFLKQNNLTLENNHR